MTKLLLSLALGLLSFFSNAASVPVNFTNEGVEGQSTIFRGELGASGLAQLGSVSIVDSNSGTGGSPGVFSGFDLDFVFLDLDGVYATTSDRVFGQTFAFSTGAIRPTSDSAFQPSAMHPGPTFGSLSADTIDHTLSTLNTRDGSFSVPNPRRYRIWRLDLG
jgi:hypothetical protein